MRELYKKMAIRVGLALAIGTGTHVALTAVKPLLENYLNTPSLEYVQESLIPYQPENIDDYLKRLEYDPGNNIEQILQKQKP